MQNLDNSITPVDIAGCTITGADIAPNAIIVRLVCDRTEFDGFVVEYERQLTAIYSPTRY